jgi:hypothetical protein
MAGGQSLVAQDDTPLGACYALGEAIAVNSLYLRMLFAFFILWSPALALAAYAALTAVVTYWRLRAYQGTGAPR